MNVLASTSLKTLPIPSKERVSELAKVVGFAYELSVDTILALKGAGGVKHNNARTLLMCLAHTNRIIDDGRLQDYLECSQKNINDACAAVANDAALKRMAETVWSIFSSGQSVKRMDAARRGVTLASLIGTISATLNTSWDDVKMYGSERADCTTALEAFALIGKAILRKDFRTLGRVAGRTETELATLYKHAQDEMVSPENPKYTINLKKTVIKVCGNLELKHPWR